MNRLILFIVLLLATSSWAASNAPDRRISDNDGDILSVNADGSIPVVLTGASLPSVGGTTATAGNLLVADGANFNSVAMTGDVTVNAAGVATVPTGQVLLSEINGIDSAATTATAGNILIGRSDGTSFTSRTLPIAFSQNSVNGFVGIGTTNPTDQLTIQSSVNGTSGSASNSRVMMGRDNAGVFRIEQHQSAGFGTFGFEFSDDTTGLDSRWVGTTTTMNFISLNTAETRVGIGTTDPQAGLDVVGHIRATGWTATAGRMLVGASTGEFNSVALTGDATITAAGVMTLGTSTVTATSGNLLTSDGVKFNSVAVGSGIGTRVVAGANTACSTTCGSAARCFYGVDILSGLLACSDASADTCFCGP